MVAVYEVFFPFSRTGDSLHHRVGAMMQRSARRVLLALAPLACGSSETGIATAGPGSGSSSEDSSTVAMTTADSTTTPDPTVDTTTDTTVEPTTTMVDPDSSGSSGASSESGASGETGGSFSVSGQVTRSPRAMISPNDDGIGVLYVAALEDCSQIASSPGGVVVAEADLSEIDTPVAYTIAGLPNGNYYIVGFLDDDENSDPNAPSADMGDLAYADGFGPACREVVVDNADVAGADFALNINVPF